MGPLDGALPRLWTTLALSKLSSKCFADLGPHKGCASSAGGSLEFLEGLQCA